MAGLLLGLSIGLMVAVVEALPAGLAGSALRCARHYGESRPEPVKVGGGFAVCTVGSAGQHRWHGYFIRNGQVICEDAPTRRVGCQNGDTHEVGNVTVTVRTAGTASPMPRPRVGIADRGCHPRSPRKAGREAARSAVARRGTGVRASAVAFVPARPPIPTVAAKPPGAGRCAATDRASGKPLGLARSRTRAPRADARTPAARFTLLYGLHQTY